MSEYDFKIAPKLHKAKFFTSKALYRCLWGGRGSGKTRTTAEACLLWGMMFHSMGMRGQIVCAREFLNSLEDSSLAELKGVIEEKPELAAFWDVGVNYVRSHDKKIYFSFIGLNQNLNSIKSRARILLVWVDEAETVREIAWDKLIPTIRYEDEDWTAELWITFNPEDPDSPTFKRFVTEAEGDPDFIAVKMNYSDNPWFGGKMEKDRARAERNNPETYRWIWEGEFRTNSDERVFAGKYRVADFDPKPEWDGPYQGGDFGYANDPTAAVRAYIFGETLYVSHDCFGRQMELDATGAVVSEKIPEFEKYTTRWDSASPGSISVIKRYGLPNSEGVKKWPGSVDDGIRFLKSFKEIVVHSRCVDIANEFRLYSYKVDRLTGDVMPVLVDANNHGIDALRYAIGPLIKGVNHFEWSIG